MRGPIIIVFIVMAFMITNVFAQEDGNYIQNVVLTLSVIPENYPSEKGLISTGYIGVNNNDGQSIFAPSEIEIKLTSSNLEVIKVPPRITIKENESYTNFDLILSGQEGTSEISAVFQDQTITQTISVGAVNQEVPVDVELIIMFPTKNANIDSKIPFSVFLRTVDGPTLQAPKDIIIELETRNEMVKLKNNQLVIKKGEFYTLGELQTKSITGTTFVKASIPDLGINSVSSLKIFSNVPKNLKMSVFPNILMKNSEANFGIFVGLYDEFDNPVKAREDVKLSLSANRGDFLANILDEHTKDIRSVIKKGSHALFFNINSEKVFARNADAQSRDVIFNYTIAVSSNNYGSSNDLLMIVDRPDESDTPGENDIPKNPDNVVKIYLPPSLPTDSIATVTYQAGMIVSLDEDEDEADDEDEETTKNLLSDFEDGDFFPGQLDKIFAPISNKFNSVVDNLRVTSDDNEVLKITEIGNVLETEGWGFATIKTGQKLGTANISVDMKGWGFGSNSTEIVNPIKPVSTKIFSPTGEDKIFFNNDGISELVVVTLDLQERGTSTDKSIEYIITPVNDIVSIYPGSTYGTIEIRSSMFGNLLKEIEEQNQLAKELAKETASETATDESTGFEEIERISAIAEISVMSVGNPDRPELEKTQEFILEPSPTTSSISLPFSHIALRGIEEEHNIGTVQITDHFGNSIQVSKNTKINLDSSDLEIIEVPSSVLILKGESFVKFPITTKGNEGDVTLRAQSSGIKFDSEFDVSTSSYSTRLSLFVSPPEELALEVGKQYELISFVDDEFGEPMIDAKVIFVGTNLEFFPFEATTDEFGGATTLMKVTEEEPDVLPSVQVFAEKPGYIDDDVILEFEYYIVEEDTGLILGMEPWMLTVILVGVIGGAVGMVIFFLRKTKTDEEKDEEEDEDEDLI